MTISANYRTRHQHEAQQTFIQQALELVIELSRLDAGQGYDEQVEKQYSETHRQFLELNMENQLYQAQFNGKIYSLRCISNGFEYMEVTEDMLRPTG